MPPGAAGSLDSLSLLIGEIIGKQEGMGREIGELKTEVQELREGQQTQERKLDLVGVDVKRVLSRLDDIDDRCDRRHPSGTASIKRAEAPSPASESLGQFFSRMGVKALETGALAGAVALLWFVFKLLAAGGAP